METIRGTEAVRQYWESDSYSQSKLKTMLGMYKEEREELYHTDKQYFTFGSAVDTKVTMPEHYYDMFLVTDLTKKPSQVITSIIQQVFDNRVSDTLADNYYTIVSCAIAHNYGKGSYGDDRIVNEIMKEELFWKALILANGRAILTQSEEVRAEKIAKSIKEHPLLISMFEEDLSYQEPLYFDIDGIPCRALPDIRIRRSNRIIDIKTGLQPPLTAIHLYRYDFQTAFYTEAARQNYEGVALPRLIFANSLTGNIKLYQLSQYDFDVGKYGTPYYTLTTDKGVRQRFMLKKPIKGFMDAINMIQNPQYVEESINITNIWE